MPRGETHRKYIIYLKSLTDSLWADLLALTLFMLFCQYLQDPHKISQISQHICKLERSSLSIWQSLTNMWNQVMRQNSTGNPIREHMYFIEPPSSPETIQLSLWLHTIDRIAWSWAYTVGILPKQSIWLLLRNDVNMYPNITLLSSTWSIISKLNDCPFQRVNSPLWDPVISRLPVGVHFKRWRKILIRIRKLMKRHQMLYQ